MSFSSSTGDSPDDINRKSFILGMITAFAECLANECKKGALSPPFYPQDYELIRSDAERIAGEQGISLWFEKNEDIPEAQRVQWLVMFKFPDVLEEYMQLRGQGFNPVWHLDKFYRFLSYGTVWGQSAHKVIPQFREIRPVEDTVARFLLKPGDWPVAKPVS